MMLKHAIDVYNFLLDLVDFIKGPSLKFKTFLSAVVATVFVALSLVSTQAIGGGNADQQTKLSNEATSMSLSEPTATPTKQTAQAKASESGAKPATNPADPNTAKKTTTSTKDQAASADPTASKSFKLPITKNGQYDAGTLIAYDATKEDKTFYAGDLSFSVGSVTISKSNPALTSNMLKITTADNAAASVPSKPSDDSSTRFTISLDASQPNESSSAYNMIIELSGTVDTGTYQLHVAAARNTPANASWWYHGFITVNVVD